MLYLEFLVFLIVYWKNYMRKYTLRFQSQEDILVAWQNFEILSLGTWVINWSDISWKSCNDIVIQIRRRIYIKTVELNNFTDSANLPKFLILQLQLRSLQRKLLFCQSNLLVSVRHVTQPLSCETITNINFYKSITLDCTESLRLLMFIKSCLNVLEWQRYHFLLNQSSRINNSNLRIQVTVDHIFQYIVKNALEPEHTNIELYMLDKYSFRSSYKTIKSVVQSCVTLQQPWVLSVNIKEFFEIISFDYINSKIFKFPFFSLVNYWLSCSFLDDGPLCFLLLDILLSGLGPEIKSQLFYFSYRHNSSLVNYLKDYIPSYTYVRYLDSVILLCETELKIKICRQILRDILNSRGLKLLVTKKIQFSHLSFGFDYLGVTVRIYCHYNIKSFRYQLLIKPSSSSITKVKYKIRSLFIQYRSYHVSTLLKKMNPLIKEWGLYYSKFYSQETFSNLDFYLYVLQSRYGGRNHPKKSRTWIINKYFGCFNLNRTDKWVFGIYSHGKVSYMEKFIWIPGIQEEIGFFACSSLENKFCII
uniref:Putative reverse transcriptase and intron maturase n=1 Tax=Eutreptiella pomquetensis TaxID=215699 RepID=A0A223FM36_9EUGL|nr:putative reverse transcriptase and intron maturase [Eutreptiella pomquetensis]